MKIAKPKTKKQLNKIAQQIIDTILVKAAGVFDINEVRGIVVYTSRFAFEPIECDGDVNKVAEEVGFFVDNLNIVFKYVRHYRCTATLTLSDIDKIILLDMEKKVWRSLERDHNVDIVEQEIKAYLAAL